MKTAQTGMHSLPPELNEHIALCCAEQNALLWSALQDLGFDEEDSQATDAAAGPTRYDTLRRTVIANRSLTALAAVSHEWNDLAAPFLFEDLPINTINSDTFIKRVLPRRGHHFVRLFGTRSPEASTSPRQVGNLVRVLPQLPNLVHLHTPDLVQDWRALLLRFVLEDEGDQPDPDVVKAHVAVFKQQMKRISGLLKRADGANIKSLEFSVVATPSQPAELALALDRFPNLESLTVNFDMFDNHGAINPVLADGLTALPRPTPPPKLRKLVVTGTYSGPQFAPDDGGDDDEEEGLQPSYAPLLRFGHQFAATLQFLELDICRAEHDLDLDASRPTDLDDYVDDPTPFAFTSPFPRLRQLVLRDLASASATLLTSIDSVKLPALESCLCELGPDPDSDDADLADFDLAAAAARIPGFQLGIESPAFESMMNRLDEWADPRGPDTDESPTENYPFGTESTWPQPLWYLAETEDPTALEQRLQLSLEHLTEWFRSARDAQDPEALAQIGKVMEGVNARRTVLAAWAGAGAAAAPKYTKPCMV